MPVGLACVVLRWAQRIGHQRSVILLCPRSGKHGHPLSTFYGLKTVFLLHLGVGQGPLSNYLITNSLQILLCFCGSSGGLSDG